MSDAYFSPAWPAPASVRSLISTRKGGVSEGDFCSNNLAYHVGDYPQRVAVNRQRLVASMGSVTGVQWLQQTHGVEIAEATASALPVAKADACITQQRGMACAVLTADCLPILMCDHQGTQVAAVHAGWRGLAAGILVSAIKAFVAKPADILVYLGPAIGQAKFEVGAEVKQEFLHSPPALSLGAAYQLSAEDAFRASARAGHYHADLYKLASSQCVALGVGAVYGGEFCTYEERETFFSFRRDGTTGRMASLIWLAS